ncbi:CKLF-like MARVEL transmembrane domain-containing protein 4 [Acanthaster planci]|uniref:CKLF-like MARVEL transmembrane domain-containing protein 4 n=1 Tax=Acanthaster planci TaxID=133434 RepID=A0A8B7YMQ3_ACAPL|nr:CKLF-like MARVEL transmembrane domain-containing protein 4 [Acanthaster planci]XP_022094543.1 CKLF-like MARVEL transmembrane domain-containing protein 4 [Acanthaster planci]
MADLNKHDMGSSQEQDGSGRNRKCGMDMSYVRSINGALKGNQIGWTFVAFILSCVCGPSILCILFDIILAISLILTVTIFVVFAFTLEKKISRINFYLTDFLNSIISVVVYFVFSLLMIILSGTAPVMIAAGVFGFLAVAGYFGNIWYSFKRWRSSRSRTSGNHQPYDPNM